MASLACLSAPSGLGNITQLAFGTPVHSGNKRSIYQSRRKGSVSVRNEVGTDVSVDGKHALLQSGNDKLQITRVINGMWQTSGGWGKIDRDLAVDAMIRHVDAGFTTFDMADICKLQLPDTLNVMYYLKHLLCNLVYTNFHKTLKWVLQ